MPIDITAPQVQRVVGKYLLAVQEAGKVYRHVAGLKGKGKFITEVSLDETDTAQTPTGDAGDPGGAGR